MAPSEPVACTPDSPPPDASVQHGGAPVGMVALCAWLAEMFPTLPPRASLLYALIYEMGPTAEPSINHLGTLVRAGRTVAKEALGALLEQGLIEVEYRPGRPNRYRVIRTP